MNSATWTDLADSDLENIVFWIVQRDGRRRVARKVSREIHDKCDLLARHPHLGTARSELGDEVQAFSHKRWVIIFRPTGEEGNIGIEVLRILDGGRDFGQLFGNG